jgi:predicted nucleotidyltransferase
VRLTKQEVLSIQQAFKESFGGGSVYLFGSRVDDSKRGGDIDLYIEPANPLSSRELLEKKIRFKLKLYDAIGEQKIDVVVSKDKSSGFEQEIFSTRIKL